MIVVPFFVIYCYDLKRPQTSHSLGFVRFTSHLQTVSSETTDANAETFWLPPMKRSKHSQSAWRVTVASCLRQDQCGKFVSFWWRRRLAPQCNRLRGQTAPASHRRILPSHLWSVANPNSNE